MIPCYNEEPTIARVVADFRQQLPAAAIYVFDNDSSDNTAAAARDAGAIVVRENRRGKGYVVRSMFMLVDSDLYVLVDGDSTYAASEVHQLIAPVLRNDADMTVGDRLSNPANHTCFRPLHLFGNRLVANAVNYSFGSELGDIMSGYRVFSRKLVKALPLVSRGFEIETQMTVQALYYGFRIREVSVSYRDRVEGSFSKLDTFSDGAKVLLTIVNALKSYRPLAFFGICSLPPALLGLGTLLSPDPSSPEVRSLILGSLLVLTALILLSAGLVLDVANHRLRELSQLLLLKFGERVPVGEAPLSGPKGGAGPKGDGAPGSAPSTGAAPAKRAKKAAS